MRAFHEWLRDCGLVGPLRSESFTSSNMQETLVCKRLDEFLISMEWVPTLSRKYYGRLFTTIVHHIGDNQISWGPTPFWFENMCCNI